MCSVGIQTDFSWPTVEDFSHRTLPPPSGALGSNISSPAPPRCVSDSTNPALIDVVN